MGYVPLKNNTFHFSFQKGILLICIFIHTSGIDGTNLFCLYLKWLAPSPQKSNDRRYRWGKGHETPSGLCVRHFDFFGRRRLATENLIGLPQATQ